MSPSEIDLQDDLQDVQVRFDADDSSAFIFVSTLFEQHTSLTKLAVIGTYVANFE